MLRLLLALSVFATVSPAWAAPFEEPREEITGFEEFQFGMSIDEVNRLIKFAESIESIELTGRAPCGRTV